MLLLPTEPAAQHHAWTGGSVASRHVDGSVETWTSNRRTLDGWLEANFAVLPDTLGHMIIYTNFFPLAKISAICEIPTISGHKQIRSY